MSVTVEQIANILNEVIGPAEKDYDNDGQYRLNRTSITDILMDYVQFNRDRAFVIDSLQSIIGNRLAVLELCSLIEEVDLLKEGNV